MRIPEDQLNLRQRHPDFQKYLDFNENESKRVRNSYTCFLDLEYGNAPLQKMDIFPAQVPHSPMLIFIHGGYWRALDKNSYSFMAEPFINNNITVCVINYRLIPMVNMEDVLLDIQKAINWIRQNANKYHGDPSTIAISGHSAGGHLALMAYLMNENLRPHIKTICSLSGIFDLEPIRRSYLNEVLNLSKKDVDAFSLINKDLSILKCPTLLGVGSHESDFFINQSNDLYIKFKTAAPIEFQSFEQLNHYQIIHQFGMENSPASNFVLNKLHN